MDQQRLSKAVSEKNVSEMETQVQNLVEQFQKTFSQKTTHDDTESLLKSTREACGMVQSMVNDVWTLLPRPKTARLLRELLDALPREIALEPQLELVSNLLSWARETERTFLAHMLECRQAALFLASKKHSEALATVAALLKELKRLDDCLGLVEVHLLECRVQFDLGNGPKARAALTAARANANSIYVAPQLQSKLDMQSAILFAEDGDFGTAVSYLIEALDNAVQAKDRRAAATAVKYLLLCKVMLGLVDEMDVVLTQHGEHVRLENGSLDPSVDAMVAVGRAYHERSLGAFEAALAAHPVHLGNDVLIHAHFTTLYDRLLVANLLDIVEPYSRVSIELVAQRIGLSTAIVESRLSVMILDAQLDAIIDQEASCLVVGRSVGRRNDHLVQASEGVMHLEAAVDSLWERVLV